MDLVCQNGEMVVKSFDCPSKRGKTNIVVTNKRLVATVKEKRNISRKEVSLADIKTFECKHGKTEITLGKIISSLFCFCLCAMAIVMSNKISLLNDYGYIVGAFFLIVGILFLIRRNCFSLCITLRGSQSHEVGDSIVYKNHKPVVRIVFSIIFCAYMCIFIFMNGIRSNIQSVLVMFSVIVLFLIWAPYLKRSKHKKIKPIVKVKSTPYLRLNIKKAKVLANELSALLLG